MRLIDADAIAPKLEGKFNQDYVRYAPTIDAVPVVRCKECKYATVNEYHPNKPLICGMTRMCGTTPPEWFCADGERRSDD